MGNNYNTGDTVVAASQADLSAYVTKATADANSVLYAVTDDTPAALAVGASTFVGRKASGNVAAMTAAESLALLGHDTRSTVHTDALRRTGALAETFPRQGASLANIGPLTSQRMHLTAIYLTAGITVTNITFHAATTPLGVGVNQWFALYSSAFAKLGVTSDDTSTAWSANTEKTLALSVAYPVVTSGLYYLGIMVNAGTVPTLAGASVLLNPNFQTPKLTVNSDASLTDPASAPVTAASSSGSNGAAWAWVS